MRNFKIEEFACRCCSKVKMQPEFLSAIDDLRDDHGYPIIINSGYRCNLHNGRVFGSPKSQHLLGRAADIKVKDLIWHVRSRLVRLVKNNKIWTGIGFGPKNLHIDIRDGKRVMWEYDEKGRVIKDA